MVRDDDDAWRAIVDNYGERAELGDVPDPQPPTPGPDPADQADQLDQLDQVDRFVPPPAPPLPTTTPDRYVAWAGVFGAPGVLLLCLVLGVDLPGLLAALLVAAFVGGFLYLVVTMTREPRDPGDDGAVL